MSEDSPPDVARQPKSVTARGGATEGMKLVKRSVSEIEIHLARLLINGPLRRSLE